jgi:hypothetical protein
MSKTTEVSQFSNMPGVLAAMKRAAANLVTPQEPDSRTPLLQSVARALAHDAADALEPLAGRPIDEAERARLAAALYAALAENVPPLPNLVCA